MRTLRYCILVSAFLLVGSVRAADLDAAYTPTRSEWLKQAVLAAIAEKTAIWSNRLAVLVVINSKENSAIITITFANGESAASAEIRDQYVQSVRSAARAVLDRYAWSKGVKLSVQFA